MTKRFQTSVVRWVAVAAIPVMGAAALKAQNRVEKFLVGGTKMTANSQYEGTDKLDRPERVIVYDLTVPAANVKMDKSVTGRVLSHDVIGAMKGEGQSNGSPAEVALNVQRDFTNELVKQLEKMQVPSTIGAESLGTPVPMNTLTVHGEVTEVKMGNKTERMMIGLGTGASEVKAHVVVSTMTKDGPVVVADFNVTSQSGKKPGAAATMGVGTVGVAAAGVATDGVMDRKASVESDAQRMAKTVAKQIESIMTAPHWNEAAAQGVQTGGADGE